MSRSEKYRLGPMIRTLTDALGQRETASTLGGRRLTLRGTAVLVEGVAVHLSSREAALLQAVLACRPGVLSKQELLDSVWQGVGDGHLVEVTVARLRKRLGAAAAGIVSVPRRGYTARG